MHLNWVQPARGNMRGTYPYIDFSHIADTATTTALALAGSSSAYIKIGNAATNPTLDTSSGGLLILSAGLSNTLHINSGGVDVNYISISSNTTTNGPVITASGEANVTLHVRSKGTGNVVIGADGNPIAQFTGTAANYLVFSNAANDPGITTASAGAIKIPTLLQITNYTVPTAGAGLEFGYDTSAPTAFVQSYDRTGAAWKNIGIAGLGISLTSNGANIVLNFSGNNLVLTTPTAFTAGSKYLVIDASGNVHVSALGPVS